MNINEDKFTNKSADQIVKDVLLQHKNNTQDALAYIKNISNDDGLSLSDETKEQLKKAEDMLVNRAKRESLSEGWGLFKQKEEPVKYPARLITFPPFKKEPTIMQLPGITSLEDPIIDQALQLMRKRHPHSIINLESELGRKTFYENSIRDYKIHAYDKQGNKKEFHAGNLPLAKSLSEKLYESDLYESIDVLEKDEVVDSYHGLKEGGWTSKKKQQNKDSIKNPDTFFTKTANDIVKSNTVDNIATIGLSALTGITPALLKGVTKTAKDYVSDKINTHKKYKQGLEDLNREYGIKEDIYDSDVGSDDYIDHNKETTDLTDNLYYILSDIHPSLGDKRRPKLYWPEKYLNLLNSNGSFEIKGDNVFGDVMPARLIDNNRDNLSEKIRFILNGIKIANPEAPQGKDLVNALNSMDAEEFKQKYLNENEDIVFLLPKFPVAFTGYSAKTGNPSFAWQNGKSNQAIPVSVKDFKKIWNSVDNMGVKEKFEKKHSEDSELSLSAYLTAIEYLDEQYPNWEERYRDKYDLDRFDNITKAKIYQDWKNANQSSMIKTGTELTKDYIDKKYYLPELNKELSKTLKSINSGLSNFIIAGVKSLENNKEKQEEFIEQVLNALYNTDDPNSTDSDNIIDFINNTGIYYAIDNQLNSIDNGKVKNKESQLRAYDKENNTNYYNEFQKDKNEILKKCLDNNPRTGIKIINPNKLKQAKKEIDDLCNEITYQLNLNAPTGNNLSKKDKLLNKQDQIDAPAALALLSYIDHKLPQRIDKANRDDKELTGRDNYKKLALDFLKDLEKKYGDLNSPEATEEILKFKDKIKDDIKNPHTNTYNSVKHYAVQALKNRILNAADEEE